MLVYTSWVSVHADLLDEPGHVLPEWRDDVPGFDQQSSRAAGMNDIIAEFVGTLSGARGSANPGASVAAIGRLADWITADHRLDYRFGRNTPSLSLVEIGGRVLMVGRRGTP
ncbi:AAC(3) family N-acetyltransferase [Sphingobium sp. CCH11-B1]|uniref:AAC(3) family N-acetyltransferase n=1 Tax=Sphingobium sp. CCH11-B1 TaxID=1768781 RepID=UPI000837577D|nr:AAC(3) family N-acetyltransferase [Sphingobium sp. CCH11-B1]